MEFRVSAERVTPKQSDDGYTTRKAKKPVKRPVGKCPVCRREKIKLDFHHWDYEHDIGCRICRQCHEATHEPDGCKPTETPSDEWVANCFVQLLERYREHHSWVSETRVFRQLSIPNKHRDNLSNLVEPDSGEDTY